MRYLGLTVAVLTIAACASSHETTGPEIPASAAKAAGGITVSSADPAYGKQGETGKQVRIIGSGFEPGDQASWQRNGIPDPAITVLSTQFVSNRELAAVISIAPEAAVALYDIAIVRPGRKGGIGTEMFEVTTVVLLSSAGGPVAVANGLNDAGQIVGQDGLANAFYWSPGGGTDDLGPGTAYDLDASGTRLVGSNEDGNAVWWTGTSGAWSQVALSTACASNAKSGAAYSIAPNGVLAGGVLRVSVGKNKVAGRPVTWTLPAGTCTQLGLPAGFTDIGIVYDVNAVGQAVGFAYGSTSGNVAVVWNDGIHTVLGPGQARAISEDGTLVVGLSGSLPVFWRWSGSAWSAAIVLTSPCGNYSGGAWANDVNAAGVVVGKDCSGRARQWTVSGTTILSTSLLPRLGPQGTGRAEAVNNVTAPGQPAIAGATNDRAVYWPVP
jgi:hypothetical protein